MNNQDWLTDAQEAYAAARKCSLKGASPISHRNELFNMAASVAAERRGIEDSGVIDGMTDYVVQQVEADILNGGQFSDYKFHFVISYIHAHTPAGIVAKLVADKIMEYVNSEWDLKSLGINGNPLDDAAYDKYLPIIRTNNPEARIGHDARIIKQRPATTERKTSLFSRDAFRMAVAALLLIGLFVLLPALLKSKQGQ